MPVSPALDVVDAVRRSVEIDAAADSVAVRCQLTTGLGLPPARLWPLITQADELATWYGPVAGDLREGGAFSTVGGAHGKILEAAPPHRLELTWEYGDATDPLTIELDPEDDGTTALRLIHTSRMSREMFDRFGPGAMAVGWEIALLGLAARTEGWSEFCLQVPTPTPLWLASPEGARYVRHWSIRWAAASVAAGTDDARARSAEIETARAYGGLREEDGAAL